ncbi:DUF4229 domain-containing protein [Streptomonospora wellingtoniae]|uniref:DUF4229 domain-containing protein n=1 Tax=Streptomonospora wellingtoniae TaxID=3075544 RepID=A0ABU2KMV6_9ACTN|nr:DUF4229 domain-containing protein [Streptomonospora sp. DSM 45055]MDT0300538.1 DUF4229 domain-containing protein [Streptomonospora sp. DSM 45055]
MRSVLAYTAARLLLFAVTYAILYLLGARGLLAAAMAVLISGLVSYVLLSRQRDAVSGALAGGIGRVRGMGRRLEEGAAKEDEAQRAEPADAAADGAAAEEDGGGSRAPSPAGADEDAGQPDEPAAGDSAGGGPDPAPRTDARQEAG